MNQNKPLFIVKKHSKSGSDYFMLYCVLGYRNVTLSFDSNIIAELAGLSVSSLYDLKLDTPVEIGSIYSGEVYE